MDGKGGSEPARVDLAGVAVVHVLADEARQPAAGFCQGLHPGDIGRASAVFRVEVAVAVPELDDDLAGVDVVGDDAGFTTLVAVALHRMNPLP